MSRDELLATLPDDKKAAAIQASDQVAAAQASAGGVLANIAGILKWVAIGAAVYFGYRAFRDMRA